MTEDFDRQRLSLVNIPVRDLAQARAFYEKGLGFEPATVMEDIAFYRMNGFVLGFMTPKTWKDERLGRPFLGPTCLAVNFSSREEVDAFLARGVAAGGKLVKPAEATHWGGYSGYFADPDDNLWEGALNPFWEITAEGHTVIPR